MEIIIKETGARETLSIIDHKTGCCWVKDLIGNHDALGSQFVYDEEQGAYIADQETFYWWESVIANMQELDNRIARIATENHEKNVYEVMTTVNEFDLEWYASVANQTLDEEFGENAGR